MAHKHSVYDTDNHFLIDGLTRAVKNASKTKTMLVQHDHNSERFTFEIPRHVDGHDMSACNVVQVHYINIDSKTANGGNPLTHSGVYEVDDLQISPEGDDVVICSWLISGNATQYVGNLSFVVRFACTSDDGTIDYAWNTAKHSNVYVTEGIYNGDVIAEEYADILEQWKWELIDAGVDALSLDTTLLVEGEAADARAAGDAIRAVNIGLKSIETDLMDAFEHVVVSDNKFDNVFDASGRFDDSDGTTEKESENYVRTSKYYPITPVAGSGGMNVYIAKEGSGIAWIFFYNENMEFVLTQIANAAFTYSNIVVPDNTAYFRMYVTADFPSTSRIYVSNIKLVSTANVDYEYKVAISRNSVSYKEQALTDGQKEIARNNIGAASKTDVQTPVWEQCEGELQIGLLQKPGTIAPNLTNWAVRIVAIEEGALYRITACASEAIQMVQFHDASGNVIGRILGEKPESGSYQQYTEYEVEVPSGAASIYVCSCFNTDTALYEAIETYPIIEKGTNIDIVELVEALAKKIGTDYAPLKDKVIVNFGDSIFGIRRPPNDISTKLANLTGAIVHNCGFGGCRMAKHDAENYGAFSMYKLADAVASGDWSAQEYAIANTPEGKEAVPTYFSVGLDTLKGIDFSAVDIVTIAYGTNDFAAEVTLDDAENPQATNTYAGALRYSIETLLTAYPQLRIFVCSPIYRSWLDANNGYAFVADSDTKVMGNDVKLTDFVAKAKEVAQAYHVPFIDNYYELGMNKFNRSAYFDYNDGTHPNDTGNQLIADHMASKLF